MDKYNLCDTLMGVQEARSEEWWHINALMFKSQINVKKHGFFSYIIPPLHNETFFHLPNVER